ncbi:hypothetical protein FA95DRAFT_1140931 [Auriscalpium vulgare]|uniref:Uncharacterized protein n=1 Tax=Auriscalpium vulgare TaxID=40419 RepID=A0ACB8RWM0_9AGAM|nr:hypothetical protein FA95DRAFT_1140931 [Auriscalpium vulgare]
MLSRRTLRLPSRITALRPWALLSGAGSVMPSSVYCASVCPPLTSKAADSSLWQTDFRISSRDSCHRSISTGDCHDGTIAAGCYCARADAPTPNDSSFGHNSECLPPNGHAPRVYLERISLLPISPGGSPPAKARKTSTSPCRGSIHHGRASGFID